MTKSTPGNLHPNDPDNVWPDDGSEDRAVAAARVFCDDECITHCPVRCGLEDLLTTARGYVSGRYMRDSQHASDLLERIDAALALRSKQEEEENILRAMNETGQGEHGWVDP